MSNIVTAVFEAGACGTVTTPLFQWDYGQVLQFQGLELPDTYEVHFANTDTRTSVTMLGNADGVDIPDACLTSGEPIYAWVFLHTGEDDGETEYTVSIPVIARAEPSDIEPTPVQQDIITQAIAALNAGVTRAETAATSAEDDATDAAASATLSESWAVGGTGTREDEDTDNAKYYAEEAEISKNTAISNADSARDYASQAANSAHSAGVQAGAASLSATRAARSETNAAASETAAATSETNAAASAEAAAQSAASAEESQILADGSRMAAWGSAVEAGGRAREAEQSATAAAASATAAAGSEASVAQDAAAAAASATAAATSEANAAESATEAQAIKDSIPADYTKLAQESVELKSAFDLCSRSAFTAPITYSRIITSSMWTVGSGISENAGSNFVNSKYCRTAYIEFTVPTFLYIDGDYEFIVWEYTAQSISGAAFSQKKQYNDAPVIIAPVQGAAYFRIGAKRKDGADITQDDITALTSSVKTFALTDTTLTLAGVPADAKATGDRCDAIDEYAKTTPMRLLANDELAEASTLLDIAPSRYFTANGAKIKALEPSFPFDIGDSTSYFVIVYKYASNFKYVRVLSVDGKRDFTGGTAASHPTAFYWNDISPDSSALNPTVKILIFGNSSTYSTWGYLPSLLSEFCSGYNFKIGILYASGMSLGGHMIRFNNNTAYTEYSVFENGVWTNTANAITGKNALDADEWDIIAVQQADVTMMNGTGKADVDGLCALIAAYIDYPVQFVMNMQMTKGANCSGLAPYYPDIDDPEGKSDAAFADFANYCRDALAESYISHIIPCGTAIQNARHTTLKQYGTYEYLCDDDAGHLQNGIGVLCASYAAAYKLLEIIGEKAKLFGSPLNPTDDWLAEINLFTKTAHGTCVGVTDANKILAQRCALQAIKNPYVITAIT